MQTAAEVCYGQLGSIGATALQIQSAATKLNTGLTIKALSTNTHIIYIGDSGVTTSNGFPLSAGNTVNVPVIDASTIYAVSAGTGDALAYIGS